MKIPDDLPRSEILWERAVRIIPSRFPPVGLFDRVAASDDLRAVFEVEGLTNARLREMRGETHLLRPDDRQADIGTAPIMAAFTHPHPLGSRFGTANFGTYEAAGDLETALRETIRGRERFLGETKSPPEQIDMRVYYAQIRGNLYDLRGLKDELPELYDPKPRAAATQGFGEMLRSSGASGIVYDSLHNPGGECISLFQPGAIKSCRQGEHFTYVWDGDTIRNVYVKKQYQARP